MRCIPQYFEEREGEGEVDDIHRIRIVDEPVSKRIPDLKA